MKRSNNTDRDVILYLREDNYFLDTPPSLNSAYSLCPSLESSTSYCYVVDKHCPFTSSGYIFGGFSDKVYLVSSTPSVLLFSLPTKATISNHWPPGTNTEMYLTSLLQSHGYMPKTADLRRTDVRFVEGLTGGPCVNTGYMDCNR